MTSKRHAFPTTLRRAALAASLLAALTVSPSAQADHGLLAGEVDIEESASAPAPRLTTSSNSRSPRRVGASPGHCRWSGREEEIPQIQNDGRNVHPG
jgi:hypothetical protein